MMGEATPGIPGTLAFKAKGAVQAPEGFEVGATVQLRSGGPQLTVREMLKPQNGAPYVRVDWFDDVGNACSGDYYVAQLVRIIVVPAIEVELED